MAQAIKGFNVGGLPNDNHLTFNMMVISRAKADEAVNTKFAQILAPYEAAVAAEDTAMHQQQASELTPLIEAADANRDAAYDAFERIVEGYRRFPDAATMTDAALVQKFLKLNKVNTSAQYDRETGQILNLIQDLEANCAEAMERLHITPMLERLKVENDEMYRLLNERDILNSERVRGAVRTARRRVDELYIALKGAVNAFALVEAPAVYAAFIESVNETIDRLNLQVFKISSADSGSGAGSDSGGSESEGEGGTDGGEGTDEGTDNPAEGDNTGGSGPAIGEPTTPGPGGDDPDLRVSVVAEANG